MRKLDFLHALSRDYDKIDEKNVLEIKSGVTGLCGDIDRFFRLNLGMQLTEETPLVVNGAFAGCFPNLAKMTPQQLDQLKGVFCKIRNVNCHLVLSRSIKLPEELLEFFNTFPAPPYPIIANGELTTYGMLYVLAFLSNKHQLSAFVTAYIQSKYFCNFLKKETSDVQMQMQRYFRLLCGKGRTTLKCEPPFEQADVQTFNDTYKKHLTQIFFGIEKSILKWKRSSVKAKQFRYLLETNLPFSKNRKGIADLVHLRNCLIHGVSLFDEIEKNGKTVVFSLEEIVSVLRDLKNLLTGYEDYAEVLQLITDFGEKLVHFYLIRMVEESYKILDKSLLTEDKIVAKVETLNRLTLRFTAVDPKYFEMATELIGKEEISYPVNASRFPDLYPRELKTELLKVVKVTSDEIIKIGELSSGSKEISFVLVDVDAENMNAINGVSPLEMKLEVEEYYSSKIGVCKICV